MFHVPAHKQLDPAKLPGQIVNPLVGGVVHQVKAPSADFAFRDHGSVCILTALSEEAIVWVRQHLPADAPRWAGGIAIESHFVNDILAGICDDGLEVA